VVVLLGIVVVAVMVGATYLFPPLLSSHFFTILSRLVDYICLLSVRCYYYYYYYYISSLFFTLIIIASRAKGGSVPPHDRRRRRRRN